MDVPDDKSLADYLGNKWNYLDEITKIPVSITNKDNEGRSLSAFHYIISNNYSVENLQVSQSNSNFSFLLSCPNISIIRVGNSTTNELEVVVDKKIKKLGSLDLIYENENTNVIHPDIHEPTHSVNNFSNYQRLLKLDTKLSFNKAKSWIDWTSISFSNK